MSDVVRACSLPTTSTISSVALSISSLVRFAMGVAPVSDQTSWVTSWSSSLGAGSMRSMASTSESTRDSYSVRSVSVASSIGTARYTVGLECCISMSPLRFEHPDGVVDPGTRHLRDVADLLWPSLAGTASALTKHFCLVLLEAKLLQ